MDRAHTPDRIKVSFLVPLLLANTETTPTGAVHFQQSLESPEVTPHFLPFWDIPDGGTGKGVWAACPAVLTEDGVGSPGTGVLWKSGQCP